MAVEVSIEVAEDDYWATVQRVADERPRLTTDQRERLTDIFAGR